MNEWHIQGASEVIELNFCLFYIPGKWWVSLCLNACGDGRSDTWRWVCSIPRLSAWLESSSLCLQILYSHVSTCVCGFLLLSASLSPTTIFTSILHLIPIQNTTLILSFFLLVSVKQWERRCLALVLELSKGSCCHCTFFLVLHETALFLKLWVY